MIKLHYIIMSSRFKKLANNFLCFIDSKPGQIISLSLAIGLFLVLTLSRITANSIWFDEGYSLTLSQHSFGDIFNYTASDVHPPLYYWLLKIWSSLFGTSDFAYRSLSVVFGCATIVLLFLLLRHFFKNRTSLFVALIVAMSPMLVRYGVEARMYTMITTIGLAATLVLVNILKKGRVRDYVIYGLLVAIGMWTHYFTLVFWLGHWLFRYIYLRKQSSSFKESIKKFLSKEWLATHALAILIFVPWIPYAIKQFTNINGGGFWIPDLTLSSFTNLFSMMFVYLPDSITNGKTVILEAVSISLVTYLAMRVWRNSTNQQRTGLGLIITLSLAPILFLAMVSVPPFRSFFHERYLMPTILMIYTLFSIVPILFIQKKLKPLWLPIFTLIIIVALIIKGIVSVYHNTNTNFNDPWPSKKRFAKELVQEINRTDNQRTPIIFCSPFVYMEAFNYSSDKNKIYYPNVVDVVGANDNTLQPLYRENPYQIKDFKSFLKQHNQIWLAISDSSGNDCSAYIEQKTGKTLVKMQTIGIKDILTNITRYKATLYKIK